MEAVLAVLLLFGGFTLGSIAADKGDDETQSVMTNSHGVPDSHQHAPTVLQSDPSRYDSDGAVIYRDLTVPYHGQLEWPATEISDCEEGGPDE